MSQAWLNETKLALGCCAIAPNDNANFVRRRIRNPVRGRGHDQCKLGPEILGHHVGIIGNALVWPFVDAPLNATGNLLAAFGHDVIPAEAGVGPDDDPVGRQGGVYLRHNPPDHALGSGSAGWRTAKILMWQSCRRILRTIFSNLINS